MASNPLRTPYSDVLTSPTEHLKLPSPHSRVTGVDGRRPSKGLRAHFTRATCPCLPPYRPAGCHSGNRAAISAGVSRIRPVPEPPGIDVDRRRDHPVDLTRYRELVAGAF